MPNPSMGNDTPQAPLPLSQEALEAMPFPFVLCTCDGLYVAANDLVEQLFRVPKAALIGQFNFLTDPVSEATGTRVSFHAASAGQRAEAPPTYYDFSFPGTRSSDRTGCWVTNTFLPFRDPTGVVTHIGMLIQDVSERVEFEQKTLRLTAMIENALDAMGTINLQGGITYCNTAYLALTGYGAELIGQPITTIFADDGDAMVSAINQVVTQGQWRGHLRAWRADGSSFPAEVSAFPLRDHTGEIIGMAATIRDLTEQQAQEQRLRRLETLVEHAPDAISITSPEGRLEYANPAYRTLFGADDALFQLDWQAFYPADVVPQMEAIGQAIFTDGVWRGTLDQQDTHGRRFPVQLSTFLMRDDAGNPNGFASIIRDVSAQYAHENRLRMFEALVESAAVGMAITDLEGVYTYANTTLRDTYGYGEDMVGMSIPMLLPTEAQPIVGPGMAQLFATGRLFLEAPFRCRDGSLRPTAVDALLIRGAGGAPLATAAIIRDLSEERAREQELRMSRFSLDHLPDNIHWVDPSSKIVYVNDTGCTLLGYTRDELIGLSIADIDPVVPAHQGWDTIWGALKAQGTLAFEGVHQRKDGSTFPVDIVASYLEFEGRAFASVVARDISRQRAQERELRLAKFSLDRSPDAIQWVNSSGRLVDVNDGSCKMLGYTREELLQFRVADIDPVFPLDDFAAVWNQFKQDGSQKFETIHRRKDGTDVNVEIVSSFVEFEGDEYGCMFARDISERKQAEVERANLQEQVIAAQQAALRELSTPLIPIAEGVVAMPLIGSIDSSRAQLVVETLLTGTAELRAHTTIIDITGVPVVDTQVANALLRAAQAVKLLGARVILTGIRPEVAQTLVGLGVDLSGISTRGALQAGIAEALGRGSDAAPNGRR